MIRLYANADLEITDSKLILTSADYKGSIVNAETNTGNDIVITNSTISGTNVGRGFIGGDITLNDSSVSLAGTTDDKDDLEHGFNAITSLKVNSSNITITGGSGRGITLGRTVATEVTVTGNSTINITDMEEATIQFSSTAGDSSSLKIEETAEVFVDTPIVNETSGTTSGTDAVVTGVAVIGEKTYPTLTAAIEDAQQMAANGEKNVTITLNVDIVTGTNGASEGSGAFNVTGNIILDGNNHSITAADTYENAKVHVLNIMGDAKVKNLVVDANAKANYGVSIYDAEAVLENVEIKNGRWYGLGINGADVTVDGLTTSGSKYAAINVDSRNGSDAKLTVKTAKLDEAVGVYVENSKGDVNVSVQILDGTYKSVAVSDSADAAKTSLTIYGGSYTVDVSAYAAEGLTGSALVNGVYLVHECDEKTVIPGSFDCKTGGVTDSAKCSVCGNTTVEAKTLPAGHKLTKVAAKAATSEAEGNIEYYVCEICGKLYTDETAAKEITLADTVLAKVNSNPNTGDVHMVLPIVLMVLSMTGAALVCKKREMF